jgi:hypothetical protein
VRPGTLPLILLACALPALAVAQTEAPPPEQAPPATTTAPASGPPDHEDQLRRLNARVGEIEGRILLAQEKVDLLRDVILGGTIARSRAVITHKNDMGNAFVLERVTYLLDGGVLLTRDNNDGGLNELKEFEIYNGAINPGEHELAVSMTWTGSSYGFFTYAKGYKFNVDSKYTFVVPEGRQANVNVVSFSKQDITTDPKEKIAVRYDLEVAGVAGKPAGTAEPAKPQETTPAQ